MINEQLQSIPNDEERVLLATGRFTGEGFDDARLDTLFLVMPIAWYGTLQQYAGGLHRMFESTGSILLIGTIIYKRSIKFLEKQEIAIQKRIGRGLEGLTNRPPIGDIKLLQGSEGFMRLCLLVCLS